MVSGNGHFNSGHVFGRVTEVEELLSSGGKPYLSIKMNVSGAKSGQATAFCRVWGEKRCQDFMGLFKTKPAALVLRGMMTSYCDDEKNIFYNNFTCFSAEATTAEARAVFILRGEVDQVTATTDGGQRVLLRVIREAKDAYQESSELFELWLQGEKLFDAVAAGQDIEVKGMIRQGEVDDFYGGGDGPVRAYVDKLKILSPF